MRTFQGWHVMRCVGKRGGEVEVLVEQRDEGE